jgi:hypothetical protein
MPRSCPKGLAVIVHETTPRDLTWDEWDRFAAFAEHKGLGDVAAMQEERGLDRIDVREELLPLCQVAGRHRPRPWRRWRGRSRTEFVALANPYTDDLAGAFPVQLWLDGEPRRTSQVEVSPARRRW